MIGTIDIKLNAANPQVPLDALHTFVGSPSQVRVINAPKAIGAWKLTRVFVTANYPDNSSQSVEAVLTGGCWHATIPAPTVSGKSLLGFKVTANGVKEDGTTAITGYVIGCGDVIVLDADSTVVVGGVTYYMHLVDSTPASPKKGDFALDTMKLWNGSAWVSLGGGGGDVTHAEFADMSADLDPDESSMGDVMTKVNTLITKLKGTATAVVAILAIAGFGAVDVQTAKLSTLPGKTMVVTNVAGAASSEDVVSATNATLAAAKADAAGKYLPLTGGTVTGNLTIYGGPGAIHKGWEHIKTEFHNFHVVETITLPKYLASLAWVGTEGYFWHTLDEYCITDAYTKTETETVATNAAESVVGNHLYYASTNLADNVELRLFHGEWVNAEYDGVGTADVILDLTGVPTDKVTDTLMVLNCAATGTLKVATSDANVCRVVHKKGDKPLELKVGPNLLTFSRYSMANGTNDVLVTNNELE